MDSTLNGKLIGWTKCSIISICPKENELKDILGEEEIEDMPEYFFTKRNGSKCARLDFYLSNSDDEIFMYTIYLDDSDKTSKSGDVKLYINQLGDTQWSNSEENLWDSFTSFQDILSWKDSSGKTSDKYFAGARPNEVEKMADKVYHIAKNGESELVHLLKMVDSHPDLKSPDTSFFIDVNTILDGDLTELLKRIPQDIISFCANVYIDIEDDNKQKVFKHFLPLKLAYEAFTNTPSKYSKKQFDSFMNDFSYLQDRSIYHFGKLREVKESDLPKSKEIDEESSDY